jgi:hypothetical protein
LLFKKVEEAISEELSEREEINALFFTTGLVDLVVMV